MENIINSVVPTGCLGGFWKYRPRFSEGRREGTREREKQKKRFELNLEI